jgi:hypothetical protein
MPHALRYEDVRTRRHVPTRFLIERVTHSHAPCPGEYRDVLVIRVPMDGQPRPRR